ncbi:LLM class flavin-dependent oxidoreductase [uncultured Amnibacterium sp.]|uniref:LLM class flavin-dependent oxidoreductase n=1 Tax=uncultured Amnibacterium sp. TaxID=1631851 RepID=UPI0035CAB55C
MPQITSIAFLSPGNYPDDAPLEGLEETLDLFAFGERLGFDGAWVRQRHLEHGVSSAAVFLAAATQRTHRIELGTAVIPLGYESPFRLAEDLATVDVLSGGRVQIGVSAGTPPHRELLGDLVFEHGLGDQDVSFGRVDRLVQHLRSEFLGDEETRIVSPGNVQRPRLQPHSAGLAERVWYGGVSLDSVRSAGERGLHLLTGNIVSVPGERDFAAAQRTLIDVYRGSGGAGRIALGRVIVPTDSADAATRERYRAYGAARLERTTSEHGPKGTRFARDLIGTSEQILEALAADPILDEVTELRLELPYELTGADYRQILTDFAAGVAPHLGWRRSLAAVS